MSVLQHVNVIAVDWAQGAAGPNYFQAAANTRVVGAEIATLILTAGSLGVTPSRFHIIGHSLGAHIAGYAGEKLHTLGRITGKQICSYIAKFLEDVFYKLLKIMSTFSILRYISLPSA